MNLGVNRWPVTLNSEGHRCCQKQHETVILATVQVMIVEMTISGSETESGGDVNLENRRNFNFQLWLRRCGRGEEELMTEFNLFHDTKWAELLPVDEQIKIMHN